MKKTRRGRGEGSVTYNSAKKLYVASVSGRRDESSGVVRRRFVYARNKCDVLAKLKVLHNTEPAQRLRHTESTLREYLNEWLEFSARPRVRVGTYRLYKGYVDNKIIPDHTLSGARIRKLVPSDVRSFFARLVQRGDTASLQRKIHVLLKSALKQAVKDGILTHNVCDAIDPPRVPKREMPSLNEHQSAALLKALTGNPLRALYVLALTCGLRLGEILGLQWSDLDQREGRITIHRTFDEKTFTTGEPKSERSRRTVELPVVARDALRSHQKRELSDGVKSSTWVFCDKEGRPLRGTHVIRDTLLKALKEAGLPKIRFHDLRHTAATLMLSRGVPLITVSKILGHASVGFTLQTYGHVLPSMEKDAVKKMDELFGGMAGA